MKTRLPGDPKRKRRGVELEPLDLFASDGVCLVCGVRRGPEKLDMLNHLADDGCIDRARKEDPKLPKDQRLFG